MTVLGAAGTRDEAVAGDKRRQPALLAGQAVALARLAAAIEQLYERPVDIEWAFAGSRFFILQARPITALPDPRATLDWIRPRPHGRYFRGSVIELLPDPLSPLFATMALPAWDEAMRDLMRGLGPAAAAAAHMSRLVTINDYAYYEFGLSGWQLARLTIRLVAPMRRMLKDYLGRAEARWADEARPRYVRAVDDWSARDVTAMPVALMLTGAGEVVKAAADYYLTIQSGILPAGVHERSAVLATLQPPGKAS